MSASSGKKRVIWVPKGRRREEERDERATKDNWSPAHNCRWSAHLGLVERSEERKYEEAAADEYRVRKAIEFNAQRPKGTQNCRAFESYCLSP